MAPRPQHQPDPSWVRIAFENRVTIFNSYNHFMMITVYYCIFYQIARAKQCLFWDFGIRIFLLKGVAKNQATNLRPRFARVPEP